MTQKYFSTSRLLALACIATIVTYSTGCATADPVTKDMQHQGQEEKKTPSATTAAPDFHDAHFHLTNYVQEGISLKDYLSIMGNRVGRSTLFGIPLQQTWSYQNSGDYAPGYYLHSDAPLYYYSFTDAYIARLYQQLTAEQQERFDPMITGFNPADMYAADHIRRVLTLFPGVFSGVGEFSIHKEFVSSKIAGNVASLTNPALDRIFEFCAETGLVVILHNDIDMPFADGLNEPVYLQQLKDVLHSHPDTTIIWAHLGLGRVVHPVRTPASAGSAERSPEQVRIIEEMLNDADFNHVYFDLSWDVTAKYVTATPESLQNTADILNRYPERFLFGTDNVAPKSSEAHFKVYELYNPLWEKLTPEAREKILKGNYERLFDAANKKVRAWENNLSGT